MGPEPRAPRGGCDTTRAGGSMAPRKPGAAGAAQGPSGRRRDGPAATSARVHLRLASGRCCCFGLPVTQAGTSPASGKTGGGDAAQVRPLLSARGGGRGLRLPGKRPGPGREKAGTLPRAGSDGNAVLRSHDSPTRPYGAFS